MSRSIDDLPDDLLQACLARLSLRSMARLKTVCHRWNLALSDPSLMFHLRSSMGFTQPWAFAVHSNYNHVGSYDGIQISAVEIPPSSLTATSDDDDGHDDDDDSSGIRSSPSPWAGHGHGHGHVGMDPPLPPPHRIAVLKGPPRLQYAAAGGADGRRLYILGGRTPLMSVSPDDWLVFNRVDAYDPVTRLWHETKPMLSPRYAFAVASFTYPHPERRIPSSAGSREACNSAMVIVAGGYDSSGMPLHSAEVYDVQLDRWEHIAPMTRVSGACKGHFARGRFFYVFMANNGPDAFEAYDVANRCWISVTDGHDKHVLVHPSQPSSSSSSFTNPCTIVLNL